MKLHTKLLGNEIRAAMRAAKDKGLVTEDIGFARFEFENSRSHDNGYHIQLGTDDKTSGPKKSRYHRNSGERGARNSYYGDYREWAATYDEWGWFMAEVFKLDPDAKWGDKSWGYNNLNDFN